MKLYRGENNKLESFSVHEGIQEELTESGPGIYFYDYQHRNFAMVYALNNSEIFFNDDAEEYLDKGYLYSCSLAQKESRLLNEIPAIEIKEYLESMVEDILDNNDYDTGFLRIFSEKEEAEDDKLEKYYEDYINLLSEEENVFEVINTLYETLGITCNSTFVRSLESTLDKIGSFATKTTSTGEIIVYKSCSVVIDKVIEVTKEDLNKTRNERMEMASSM